MVRSLAACSSNKSCEIICAISTSLVPFSVLPVPIYKKHTLDLSIVNLCIIPRQCKKMLSALLSHKVDPTLPSDKRLVLGHYEPLTLLHNVCIFLARSRHLQIHAKTLNKDVAIDTNLFITYFARRRPHPKLITSINADTSPKQIVQPAKKPSTPSAPT